MKNKIKLSIIAAIPLFLFAGCWDTGDGEYVGVITKIGHVGGIWQTWECEIHLVDQKGTMVADHVEASVDNNDDDRGQTVKLLKDAMDKGTRVKVTVHRELIVGCWRAETDRLIKKVELLP